MSTSKSNKQSIAYSFDFNGALTVDAASLLQSVWLRKQIEAAEQIEIPEQTQVQTDAAQSS